ncbi:hypothetical protein F5B21DRAFT_503988 [Xylaria acuta]|nr:hypothetical protein F5B21DRAFT_503988 [Xylaria acuta]
MKELPTDGALAAPDQVDEEAMVMQGTNRNTCQYVAVHKRIYPYKEDLTQKTSQARVVKTILFWCVTNLLSILLDSGNHHTTTTTYDPLDHSVQSKHDEKPRGAYIHSDIPNSEYGFLGPFHSNLTFNDEHRHEFHTFLEECLEQYRRAGS